MTVVLNCEITAMCYPKAALFCFANALIAYNALSIVKGTIAVEHGREASEMMSHFYMAREILETTDGLLVVLPAERWEGISTISASAFVAKLRQICRGIDLPTSRTSIRVPRSRHRNVRATNKPSTSPPSESSINASKPMMKVLVLATSATENSAIPVRLTASTQNLRIDHRTCGSSALAFDIGQSTACLLLRDGLIQV